MMNFLHVCLVHAIMGCCMLGAEAKAIIINREDLNNLNFLAEVSNDDVNISLQFTEIKGTREQLDVVANSIQKIAESLTCKKNVAEECKDCFTMGSQTFIAFPTKTGSWDDAKAFCEDIGFRLPEPNDPNQLAKHLRETIDVEQNYYWAGARGDGTRHNWVSGGSIDSGSKWWWPGHPSSNVASGHCLSIRTLDNPSGNSEFVAQSCTGRLYILCEKV